MQYGFVSHLEEVHCDSYFHVDRPYPLNIFKMISVKHLLDKYL